MYKGGINFISGLLLKKTSESSGKNLVLAVLALFGPPQRGWDLWFSFRPSVRVFVRSAEISKSVHRNFLIFGTKLGLPNATEVTFSDFARKIPFGRFWPVLVKKWPFLAKNQRFG